MYALKEETSSRTHHRERHLQLDRLDWRHVFENMQRDEFVKAVADPEKAVFVIRAFFEDLLINIYAHTREPFLIDTVLIDTIIDRLMQTAKVKYDGELGRWIDGIGRRIKRNLSSWLEDGAMPRWKK